MEPKGETSMNREEMIERAKQAFGKLIEEDLDRIEGIRKAPPRKDFLHLSHVKVGIMPGDGIGPYIMKAALLVARKLLKRKSQINAWNLFQLKE